MRESTYSIYFIQRLPLLVRHSQALRRLDGPFHLARPHFQIFDFLLLDEFPQTFGKLEREGEPAEIRVVRASAGPKQRDTHLFPPGRQARISSDPPLDVEVALTVAAQVDGTRRDVDVHQVVDDSALDVIEDAVHQVTTAHVHDLDVGQIPGEERGTSSIYAALSGFWWKPCCLLTCPEPHPEAGRKTRNT